MGSRHPRRWRSDATGLGQEGVVGPVDLAPSRRISAAKHGENTVKRGETY